MDVSAKLRKIGEEIFRQVNEAVTKHNIPSLQIWSQAAADYDALLQEARTIENKVHDFESAILDLLKRRSGVSPEAESEDQVILTPDIPSPKARGSQERTNWIERLRQQMGISLTGYRKKYRTQSGQAVAVAFASELPKIPGRWFLGLPDEIVEILVFLCRSADGKLYDIILPTADLGERWQALSRSKGEVKFNIRRNDNKLLLLIPHGEPMLVTPYVSHYENLR